MNEAELAKEIAAGMTLLMLRDFARLCLEEHYHTHPNDFAATLKEHENDTLKDSQK